MADKIATYEEFWPYYLREHSEPTGRQLHYLGTTLALASLLAAIIFQQPWLILLALVSGYGPAWIAHFFIEKNRPATSLQSLKKPAYRMSERPTLHFCSINIARPGAALQAPIEGTL